MAKGRILRLRGLPWSAREEDVRTFMDGHAPVDLFVLRRGEKSTGEAFVEFGTAEEAAAAQADRNHKDLGQRYIEIFSTDAESMSELMGDAEELDTGWVLRLRGLPYTATQEDVVRFFEGLEVVGGAEGVVLACGKDGRPNGEAYVEFCSEEDQQVALGRDKEKIGPRYIEIFKASKADMSTRVESMRHSEAGSQGEWPGYDGGSCHITQLGDGDYGLLQGGGGFPITMDGSVLRLRGLPYKATNSDVVNFFSDFNVAPEAVRIVTRVGRDGNEQGTGIAYVQFSSLEEAEAARNEKHHKSMGPRYIECHTTYPRSHMQHPGLQGPLAVATPPPQGLPFIPRATPPLGGLPGPGVGPLPGVLPPPPARASPVMRGVPPNAESWGAGRYQFEGPGGRGSRGRPPGMMSYGVPPRAAAPQMVPMGVPGPTYSSRQTLQGPGVSTQMHATGRGGGWRGSQAASPGPIPLQPGISVPMTPGAQIPLDFQQQQMLMHQHQYLMHQHLLQQQQAMSQMRHPGWGMHPMGGAFAPYGAAMRPQLPLQHPPLPQPARPAYTSSHLDFVAGQPHAHGYRHQADAEGVDGSSIRAPAAQGQSPNASGLLPSSPGLPASSPGGHFPLSPGRAAGLSPTSSLQSELQSLSLASRATPGAEAVTQSHAGVLPPQPLSQS